MQKSQGFVHQTRIFHAVGEEFWSEVRLDYSRSNFLQRALAQWASLLCPQRDRGSNDARLPWKPGVVPGCAGVCFHCQYLYLTGSQVRVSIVRTTGLGTRAMELWTVKTRQQESQAVVQGQLTGFPSACWRKCPLLRPLHDWTWKSRFQLASLTEAMSSPGVVPHVTVSYDSSSVIQMGIAISDIVMKRTYTQGPYLAIRGMQGLAGERTVSGGMDGKEEGCFCLEDREEKMEQLQ